MTKNEFILNAMLQLAGTGQYKDQYEKVYEGQYECKRLVTKEKQIYDDALKLAATAEAFLWKGDVSNPKGVFEPETSHSE